MEDKLAVVQEVRDKLPEGILVFDDQSYDNSIIGVTLDGRTIYVYEWMIEEYMKDNACSEQEAVDWVDYNTVGSVHYGNNKLPVIVSIVS